MTPRDSGFKHTIVRPGNELYRPEKYNLSEDQGEEEIKSMGCCLVWLGDY